MGGGVVRPVPAVAVLGWAGVLTGRLAPRRHQVLYFVPIGFTQLLRVDPTA